MTQPDAKYYPIVCFFVLLFVFTCTSYWITFSNNAGTNPSGLVLLQFSPAVAALATRLYFQHNLRGLGWGWGKTRYQIISYILPFILCLFGFGMVWLLKFGTIDSTSFVENARTILTNNFSINVTSSLVILFLAIMINSTVGLLVSFGSLGEEISWRGFLVPELKKHFNYSIVSIIVGLVWAVFHFPLLVLLIAPRLDASVWPLMVFVSISAIGLSFVLTWLRLKSDSVWTAVIFHAALNIHLQGNFQPITVETSKFTRYVSGEQGLMMAVVAAIAGFFFWRMRYRLD